MGGLGIRLIGGSNHVEGCFRKIFEFILQYALAPIESIVQAHHSPLHAGKVFRGEKWLSEKTVQLPGAENDVAILL